MREFTPAMPFHMVWLATDACTARCLHCSSNSAKRRPDELTTDEALDLMRQFAESGVVDVGISGGEPLLRRDLPEVLAYAKALCLSVGIATNGAKLSDSTALRLADLGLDRLQVSLDGFATAHETLRRWPGLFARVLRTVETGNQAGLRVHICCTINRLNVGELQAFVEFVASLPVKRLNLSRYVPTGRGQDALDIPDREWRAVVEQCAELRRRMRDRIEITTHLAQQILVDEEVAEMPAHIGCQAGRGQGCVTANGTVYPCVLLPVPLGNIRQATFQQIWTGSSIVRRLQHRETLEGQCSRCSVRERCGGCRAVAFAKTGRLFATDPRCWIFTPLGDSHAATQGIRCREDRQSILSVHP